MANGKLTPPEEAVEKALAEFKNKPASNSVYRDFEEIEQLIAALDERVNRVKKRIDAYDKRTVSGYNEFFGEAEAKR